MYRQLRDIFISIAISIGWFWMLNDSCSGGNGWYVAFTFLMLWPIRNFFMWLGDSKEETPNPEPRHGYHDAGE